MKVNVKATRAIGIPTGTATVFLEEGKVTEVDFKDEGFLKVVLGYGCVSLVETPKPVQKPAPVVPKPAPKVEAPAASVVPAPEAPKVEEAPKG